MILKKIFNACDANLPTMNIDAILLLPFISNLKYNHKSSSEYCRIMANL